MIIDNFAYFHVFNILIISYLYTFSYIISLIICHAQSSILLSDEERFGFICLTNNG